jgi:FKBP-type peptidyl-prolyl cis-trans isomerase
MARKRERIFTGFFAALFLITASALPIAVIWQLVSSHGSPNKSNNQTKEAKMNKLQGTKLANFVPITTPVATVQATDIKGGTGETVKPGATITFHYTGALAATGTIFQSSHDSGQAVTYPLSQLIKGWQEGIPGMKVGGIRRLVIPYSLGYGEAGSPQGGIPPKADLVFDIEVQAAK